MDIFDDTAAADSGEPSRSSHSGEPASSLPSDEPGPVFAADPANEAEDGGNGWNRPRCHNCGAALRGRYCHLCGQKDQDLDVRFHQLVGEWLGGVFGFDARLWRTLRILFTRPGQLTLEYLAGRRVRYVPPLRLYLVASLLMLITLSWSGYSVVKDGTDADRGPVHFTLNSEETREEPEAEDGAESSDGEESTGEPEIPAPGDSSADPPMDQDAAGEEQPETEGQEAAEVAGESPVMDESPAIDAGAEDEALADEEGTDEEGTDEEGTDEEGADEEGTDEEGADADGEGWAEFGEDLGSAMEGIEENPDAFDRSFRDYLPQALFLLVPVFAFQLWLLFRRRFRRYLHHLIFSLHAHAVVFLLIAFTRPVDHLLGLQAGTLGDVAGLAFFVYLFMALRRVYGDGRIVTGLKMLLLFMVHGLMLAFALLGAVILAAMQIGGTV